MRFPAVVMTHSGSNNYAVLFFMSIDKTGHYFQVNVGWSATKDPKVYILFIPTDRHGGSNWFSG